MSRKKLRPQRSERRVGDVSDLHTP
jgi:hypothetical protein